MEWFLPQYYYPFYLVVVTFFSLLFFHKYRTRKVGAGILGESSNHRVGRLICFFMILFIGTRPISDYFVDMPQYYGIYLRWKDEAFSFDWHVGNIIYNNLMNYLASIKFPPVLFYVFISSIYFGCTYKASRILFPNDSTEAFLVFLAAFSTFSYATNGIKAGSAAAIFLLAIAYRDKLSYSIPLVLISYGFHHSMLLPGIAFLLIHFYHNPKPFFYFWLFCLLMAIGHVTYFQYLFAGFADEQGVRYLTSTDGYLTGFRLDFILYSAMPIVLGYYAIFVQKIKNPSYDFLLCMYLFTNGIWMLCMYASFTNRIAYWSWSLYPFVLIYALLNEETWRGNRLNLFRTVAYLHLAFTLFMNIVYYRFLH